MGCICIPSTIAGLAGPMLSDPNPRVSGESIFELVWRSFSW
jgi:hypothetical protein